MKNRSDMTNSGSSKFDREANLRNQTTRRTFLQAAGLGAAALCGARCRIRRGKAKDRRQIRQSRSRFRRLHCGQSGIFEGLETCFGSEDTCGSCGLWLLPVRGGFWIPGSPKCRSGGGKRSIP